MSPQKRSAPRVCEGCGDEFLARPSEVLAGRARFCSRRCVQERNVELAAKVNRKPGGWLQRRYEKKRTTHLVQESARRKLAYAVKYGHLRRLNCELCGNENTDGHHMDYSRPLDVVWLCRPHHAAFHNNKLKDEEILKIETIYSSKVSDVVEVG